MASLISIIVPIYNVEKELSRCLESIIHQSYSNIEIVLVNDGSTDDSKSIIDKYKEIDQRIVVVDQDNSGLSAARNTGLRIARGRYIMFVDSDDYLHKNAVEILYHNIIDEDADISVCNFYWDYLEQIKEEPIIGDKIVFNGDDVKHQLIQNNLITVVAWNKLYKKEIWNGVEYPVGKVHEDEYVIHKLLSNCKRTVYTNDKLYYYIKREKSISNTISLKNMLDKQDAIVQRLLWAAKKKENDILVWTYDLLYYIVNTNLDAIDTAAINNKKYMKKKLKINAKKSVFIGLLSINKVGVFRVFRMLIKII